AAQRLGGEVELLDALEVEHHGDRGDVDGDVEGLLAIAAVGGGGQLLLVHGGVGAREVDLDAQVVLPGGAGSDCVVGDDSVGALCARQAHEGLGPRGLCVLHRVGAGGGQVAGQLRVAALRAAAVRAGVVAAGLAATAAGGQGEGAAQGESGECGQLVLANVH